MLITLETMRDGRVSAHIHTLTQTSYKGRSARYGYLPLGESATLYIVHSTIKSYGWRNELFAIIVLVSPTYAFRGTCFGLWQTCVSIYIGIPGPLVGFYSLYSLYFLCPNLASYREKPDENRVKLGLEWTHCFEGSRRIPKTRDPAQATNLNTCYGTVQ